jgi:hypothetical protein
MLVAKGRRCSMTMEARTRELELGGSSNARWWEINRAPTNDQAEKGG